MASSRSIRVHPGVAGQVQIDAGDVSFVGSHYGSPGPIFLILSNGSQHRVDDPGRFGDKFNRRWVENFLKSDGHRRVKVDPDRFVVLRDTHSPRPAFKILDRKTNTFTIGFGSAAEARATIRHAQTGEGSIPQVWGRTSPPQQKVLAGGPFRRKASRAARRRGAR